MAKALKIEDRTEAFIKHYNRLKEEGIINKNADLQSILKINSPSTISDILYRRQNIQPQAWGLFKKYFNVENSESSVYRKNDNCIICNEKERLILEKERQISFSEKAIRLLEDDKRRLQREVDSLHEMLAGYKKNGLAAVQKKIG